MRFTEQQPAAATFAAQGQAAGGVAMDAHFFFDAGTDHVVEIAQAAVFIDPVFGHQKKADTLGSFGCALDAGQNGMDDIFHQVMLSR